MNGRSGSSSRNERECSISSAFASAGLGAYINQTRKWKRRREQDSLMTPRRLSSLLCVSSSRVDESSSRWLLWLSSPNFFFRWRKRKKRETENPSLFSATVRRRRRQIASPSSICDARLHRHRSSLIHPQPLMDFHLIRLGDIHSHRGPPPSVHQPGKGFDKGRIE